MIIFMGHQIILLFYFEKGLKVPKFKNFAYLEGIYLISEIVKQGKCQIQRVQHITVSIKQFIVSSKTLCLHLLLMYPFQLSPC